MKQLSFFSRGKGERFWSTNCYNKTYLRTQSSVSISSIAEALISSIEGHEASQLLKPEGFFEGFLEGFFEGFLEGFFEGFFDGLFDFEGFFEGFFPFFPFIFFTT